MMQWLCVAFGGAFGSMCRYGVSQWVYGVCGRSFPWGILLVNVLGSFIMGVLTVLLIDKLELNVYWRLTLLVGFLGGFTTFSSFSIDVIGLIQQGEYMHSALYIIGSVLISVLAAYVGVALVSRF